MDKTNALTDNLNKITITLSDLKYELNKINFNDSMRKSINKILILAVAVTLGGFLLVNGPIELYMIIAIPQLIACKLITSKEYGTKRSNQKKKAKINSIIKNLTQNKNNIISEINSIHKNTDNKNTYTEIKPINYQNNKTLPKTKTLK